MSPTTSRTIRLGLLQHACGSDRDANLKTAVSLAQEAAAQGAELLITQELFTLPYFPQVEDEARFALAEPIPGPTTRRMAALAAELNVSICASLFEKRAAGVFHNTALLIGPDAKIVGRYRKMHIPHDPRFYEKFYFTPGDSGFGAHVLPQCRAGMLICWDQWFPEAARLTALAGAEVLLYPTAIGSWHIPCASRPQGDERHEGTEAGVRATERRSDEATKGSRRDEGTKDPDSADGLRDEGRTGTSRDIRAVDADIASFQSRSTGGDTGAERAQQHDAWLTVQRSHAIANGVYVATVNRIGAEDELQFWGSSFVVDPAGTVIAAAPGNEPAVLVVDCDLADIDRAREGWPFLRDRRIDAYGGLANRWLEDPPQKA